MKTLIQTFTDNTPVNSYSELTKGGLYTSLLIFTILAITMIIGIARSKANEK